MSSSIPVLLTELIRRQVQEWERKAAEVVHPQSREKLKLLDAIVMVTALSHQPAVGSLRFLPGEMTRVSNEIIAIADWLVENDIDPETPIASVFLNSLADRLCLAAQLAELGLRKHAHG